MKEAAPLRAARWVLYYRVELLLLLLAWKLYLL